MQSAACRCSHRHWAFASRIACFVSLSALALASQAASAQQRLSAENLLPKNTVAYLHVASVPELVAAFQQTNIGRMIADPEIKPFLGKLYEAGNKALGRVKDATGLSLDEILHIPQGELTFALIPRPTPPNGQAPETAIGFVAMVDCGDSIESARKFVDTIHAGMVKQGFTNREETVDGIVISIYQSGDTTLVSLERENTIVVCSSPDIAQQVLARWNSNNEDCLAQNPQFATVMNRCRGPKDEEPHITLFADPIGAVTEMAKTRPGLKLGMALLPTLGLDGVKAIGGSYTLSTEDFDGIMQLHLSLGYPRSGALELIALDSGDDTPPNWVPGDIAGYNSIHWDFQQTYDKGMKLVDSFQGPGVMAKTINDRTQRWFGLDVDHDILPALTGRILHITWFDHPVKPGIGGHNLIALQLRDPHAFADSFQKITSHLPPQWEKKSCAGIDYYQLGKPKDADDPRPTPCLAMFNDWVAVTDRTGILEHVLSNRDETENNLASALDYKLIASKIAQQPGGDKPALLLFNRAEAGWKYLYDLATSEKALQALHDRAGSNPFFTALNEGLDQNPLPSWDVIAKYLAPEGAVVTNDDTGIHYMAFALRRK